MKRLSIVIILSILLPLLFIIFVILPIWQNIQKSSAEILEQKAKLAQLQEEKTVLENFQKTAKTMPGLEKLQEIFLEPDFPLDFISSLEKMAQNNAVSLEIIPIVPPLKEEGLTIAPAAWYNLKIKGKFENFFGFLEELEKSPYLLKIESLTVQRPEVKNLEESVPELLDITLLISILTKENG